VVLPRWVYATPPAPIRAMTVTGHRRDRMIW
jgi:hypothetical protein